MQVRQAQSSDVDAIAALFVEVFTQAENAAEGKAIGNLAYALMTETSKADVFGFIAVEGELLIGSIVFTRLIFFDARRAFILSPVAVHSDYQGKGIGQKLIKKGIDIMESKGVDLIMTYGDPAFYAKSGFQTVSEHSIPAPFKLSQPEGWLGHSLTHDSLKGTTQRVQCVPPLNKAELW
ncbi:MAG: GNAT family N-acetyltransferase [Granulosicoccus sp.]